MKNISININKSNILEEVSLNTEYTGAKKESNSASFFDRLATIDADDALLTLSWNEMMGEVAEKLRPFIVETALSSSDFRIDLELSQAYDDAFTPLVEKELFSSIAAGVTARWFRFTMPEKESEWLNTSRNLLERAFSKLCHRRRPVRKSNV